MKQLLTSLLLLTFLNVLNAQTRYEEIVNHVQTTVGCDADYAEWLMYKIDEFAKQLQDNISFIASANEPYEVKERIVKTVINESFESRFSYVDVSSIHAGVVNVSSSYVYRYLYRLSRLKDTYNYTKVELLFNPDYLGIGKFYKTDDSTYELSVTMIQIFRAWYGENVVYSDETRKKFRLNFHVDENNRLTGIKVDRILVTETKNIEDRFK